MASRFKKRRLEKGYSQMEVGMKSGIDQSDLSKIERGLRYPNIPQLVHLAKLYDTSADYLIGLTDNPAPYTRSDNPSFI